MSLLNESQIRFDQPLLASRQQHQHQQPKLLQRYDTTTSSSRFDYVTDESKRIFTAAYDRFYWCHCLALLPSLAMLGAALAASISFRDVCNIIYSHRHLEDDEFDRGSCQNILDFQLLVSTLALGMVSWLASHAARKACWALSSILFGSADTSAARRDRVVVSVAISLQALVAESLRVLSFYWASCILVSSLYLYPRKQHDRDPLMASTQEQELPQWAWRLTAADPRFFVATWSALAWALAEFGFGSSQILRQVGLYRPTLTIYQNNMPEHEMDDEQDDQQPANVDQNPDQNGNENQDSAFIKSGTERFHSGKPLSNILLGNKKRLVPAWYGAVDADGAGGSSSFIDPSSTCSSPTASMLEVEIEDQMSRFLLAKERAQVEAVLGVPLPEIPILLCALWRLDAMLWSIGSHLLLSSAFTHAQGNLGVFRHSEFEISDSFQLFPQFGLFQTTFFVLVILHTLVSIVWATGLAHTGFATTTYASLLFGLLILVAGLARWGLLI